MLLFPVRRVLLFVVSNFLTVAGMLQFFQIGVAALPGSLSISSEKVVKFKKSPRSQFLNLLS
jgi:hypothetical protein